MEKKKSRSKKLQSKTPSKSKLSKPKQQKEQRPSKSKHEKEHPQKERQKERGQQREQKPSAKELEQQKDTQHREKHQGKKRSSASKKQTEDQPSKSKLQKVEEKEEQQPHQKRKKASFGSKKQQKEEDKQLPSKKEQQKEKEEQQPPHQKEHKEKQNHQQGKKRSSSAKKQKEDEHPPLKSKHQKEEQHQQENVQQQKQQQPHQRRKKASSTNSKQPILPKNEKRKPLFVNRVASLEETRAMKQTLSTLRALFASETLPYYDQFSTEPHRTCFALVFTAICCLFKICLYGLMIGMTIIFHIDILNYLLDAFQSIYEDNDISAPAVPGAIIQILQSLCIGIYAFCSAAILVDLSIIAASFLRHTRAISISMAAGFFVNFWAIFFMFFIGIFLHFIWSFNMDTITVIYTVLAVAGFNQKELTSSFMGNLVLRDFELTPTGKIIHNIQEQFQCCGFEGPKDWHKQTMFHWEEPGIEESRTIPYPLHWLENCTHSNVCYSPKSCCTSDAREKPTCNQANMTQEKFNEIVDKNFTSLSKKIKPKYHDQINNDGCIEIIGERMNNWSMYALGISISALILWIIIVMLLSLSLSEMSGMGSVNTNTSMVDPKSLKDIVPCGEVLDELCCCGGGTAWPIYDEGSERDAIREDRNALIAIEEGKSLRDIDLTGSTSNIALFLPSMKEIRRFAAAADNTSSIEQPPPPPRYKMNERQKK